MIHPIDLYYSRTRASALAVGAGAGAKEVAIFSLIYHFSSFSLSLADGQIYTDILCQRSVKPERTNQPTILFDKIILYLNCQIADYHMKSLLISDNLPIKKSYFDSNII